MAEFWETNFIEKQEMWGLAPANSALLAKDLFVAHAVKTVLVPGIGYGRNGQVFREQGMDVTGIEVSETAIALARKHHGADMAIHHGSVTDMPFDDRSYDGIFCHALLHLLDADQRRKLIADCYRQLAPSGCMVFTVISKAAPTYGKGKHIGPDRYELFEGAKLYFYDRDSIALEFAEAGLVEVTEVDENFPFYFVACTK